MNPMTKLNLQNILTDCVVVVYDVKGIICLQSYSNETTKNSIFLQIYQTSNIIFGNKVNQQITCSIIFLIFF
jgi:hypothetical protein